MADYQTVESELDQAARSAAQANEFFNNAQLEAKKEEVAAAERTGQFSAAAISLSFTLIGYLFSNLEAKQIITGDFLVKVHLFDFLIIGWVGLLFSVVASLLIRLLSARHLKYNAAHHWSATNLDLKTKLLAAIDAGSGVFLNTPNIAQAKVSLKESRDTYGSLEKELKRSSKMWLAGLNLASAFVYVGAVVGFVSISIFLILLTYGLIFQ